MESGKKAFWGIYFILAAVLLICYRVGWLHFGGFLGVGFWGIMISIFLLGFTIKGIITRNVGEIIFSIAFIIIIFDGPLGIEYLTPWYVLGAAILLSIGLGMIIKPKNKGWNNFSYNGGCNQSGQFQNDSCNTNNRAEAENVEGERVWFKTNFGSGIKYVKSNNFQYADLTTSFGSMKVYFDNAIIQPGTDPVINVNNSFGCIQIYVPRTWHMVNQARSAFGCIEEKNQSSTNGAPTVRITGSTDFGAVEVYYI